MGSGCIWRATEADAIADIGVIATTAADTDPIADRPSRDVLTDIDIRCKLKIDPIVIRTADHIIINIRGSIAGRFSAISDNWLVVIFKLLSEFGDGQFKTLEGVNALDVTILLLVGITLLGLFTVLRKTSKIWSLIAAVLPFLGLVVFLTTGIAGRSALMAAILIISIVMLRDSTFSRVTAWLGILASMLLLAGDFSVGSSYASAIAPLFGIGYLLLITWLFLTGIKLFQLDKSKGRMSD